MDGWQQAPEPPAWHDEAGQADRDRTVTESPSRLPATLGVIAIIAIVGAVIAIAILHGGGIPGIAVPAAATTTSASPPEPDSVEIENADARLSYRVPKTWQPEPDANAEVLGVRFGGAASYAPYPCGGEQYSRAFATSAAVQSTSTERLDPRETAERFAIEFAGNYFPGGEPGDLDTGESELDGRAAVLVALPVTVKPDDPACAATSGVVTVLAVDLDNASGTTKAGVALLVVVADTAGGPDEPVPPSQADLKAIITSAEIG